MLLDSSTSGLQAVGLLEGITGLDVAALDNRSEALDQWYRAHRAEPQHQWFLDALAAAEITTNLQHEQFAPGAGLAAVPELTRLLVEAPEGRLRVLASAMLRQVTREDYGVVTPQTPRPALEALAVRYRYLVDGAKAASGR
jgi:hypothetical protein